MPEPAALAEERQHLRPLPSSRIPSQHVSRLVRLMEHDQAAASTRCHPV
jgi:hypothetical protein